MAEIFEITPQKDRAEDIEKIIKGSVKKALEEHGHEVAGFGLVVWNAGGRCTTAYYAGSGLVCNGLVPSLVHDALQRHITLNMMADGEHSETILPD